MIIKKISSFFSSLAFILLWGILTGVAYLPELLQRALVRLGYFYWKLFAKRDQGILFANLEQIFQLPRHSSFAQQFARQNIEHQLQIMIDTVTGVLRPAKISIRGLDTLSQLMHAQERDGRGQLVTTAHIGSWELLASFLGQAAGKPVYVLAKTTRLGFLNRMLENLREKGYSKLMWTDSPQLKEQMTTAVRAGEWLGFAMDQKPTGRRGPLINFMGQPTPFVVGPVVMAQRHGCPIISVYCIRTGPRCYELQSRLVLPSAAAEVDISGTTQVLADDMERVIRLYPEQWCWNYKRWVFGELRGHTP